MDVDGIREPLVHFLSGSDEIEASRITIEDGNTDGKSWKAELDIDESVAALEDKGFLGFKIMVFDKSGNERWSVSRMMAQDYPRSNLPSMHLLLQSNRFPVPDLTRRVRRSKRL